jgi:hypothetical protein
LNLSLPPPPPHPPLPPSLYIPHGLEVV